MVRALFVLLRTPFALLFLFLLLLMSIWIPFALAFDVVLLPIKAFLFVLTGDWIEGSMTRYAVDELGKALSGLLKWWGAEDQGRRDR